MDSVRRELKSKYLSRSMNKYVSLIDDRNNICDEECGRLDVSNDFQIDDLPSRTSGGRRWQNGRRNVDASSHPSRKPSDYHDQPKLKSRE